MIQFHFIHLSIIMSPLYCFQFILYSFCFYLFVLYSYVVYYSDLFSLHFRDKLLPEYDYIIVGSGTAGSVITHRLATETNYSFIVLEAGSKGHFLMDIPIVGPVLHRSLFDWMYETVPQEYACWAMEERKCRLFQGKIIGGSSKLNNMIHVRGVGPLTTPGCEVVGFVSTRNESTPDLQFMVLPMGISTDRGSHLRKSVGIIDNIWNEYFVKVFDTHTATMVPIILHPKSKGTVFINSTDPKLPPVINPQYLTHKEDREILLKGLKLITKFLETSPMKDIGAKINPIPFPGCENFSTFSDMYWECYIKHVTLSIYHPIGTCSMGLSPVNSVIDTNFKVFGVDKLYVTDASVLPTLPSGNINAAVAMMASIFFEINVKGKIEIDVCNKNDMLKELLFQICLSNQDC